MIKHTLKIVKIFAFVFMIALLLNACDFFSKPSAKIAVMADPHYFNPELLISDGVAFQTYLAQDRKMLKESGAILTSAVDAINSEDVDIVLVPGDLTKDGERISHENVALFLKQIECTGKKVYVIPGNHDINNPHAVSYDGDQVYPAETVDPYLFKKIYKKFGYGEAIYRDKNSLSYVAEPVKDLWIIGLDSCKYESNFENGHPETGGALKPETLCWVKKILQKADKKNKTVLGMMHHGMLEHYQGQSIFFPEYVVDDFEAVSTELADLGLKIIFTGHYHAQDIVKKATDTGNFIYDIETGSLITYPSPYRLLDLEDDILSVSSNVITEIDYDLGDFADFQEYAFAFIQSGLHDIIVYMLVSGSMSAGGYQIILSEADALMVAPFLTAAFIAHYAGDEFPDAQTIAVIQMLMMDPDPGKQILGNALAGLWTDLPPSDNAVIIDLVSGDML